jgi:hypothetical protein
MTASVEVKARQRGTPHGGVLGPLVLNLFLHYALDRWLRREMPMCPFARYADDGVVHCRTEWQAQEVQKRLAARLRECGLELHPDKTRIVYCKDSTGGGDYLTIQFTSLGFSFGLAGRRTARENSLPASCPGRAAQPRSGYDSRLPSGICPARRRGIFAP